MIKIYDKNNNFIKQIDRYKDMRIEKEVNKLDLLFFNVPKQLGYLFEEEGYIETKDHGRFVIKEKNIREDIEIVGKYDLEDLNRWVESKSYITENIIEIGEDLLEGTGWELLYGNEEGRNLLLNSGIEREFDEDIETTVEYYDEFERVGYPWGRNYFRPSLVNNLAFVYAGGIYGVLRSNPNWRGFYIPVKPGEIYSLSRTEIINNRFGVYFTEEEPADEIPVLQKAYRNDTALKIEGIEVPEGANYLFVYLSNQADELPKIKLEKGSQSTPWTPAPDDFNNLKGKQYNLSTTLKKDQYYTLSVEGAFVEDDFVGVWLGSDKFIGYLDEDNKITFKANEQFDDDYIIVKSLSEEGVINKIWLTEGEKQYEYQPNQSDLTLAKRTVTGTNMSILSFLKKAVDTFNYDIKFDNINKKIYVADELGTDKGVYFHDELNLRQISISSDTHDFATRLIPRGLNGEGIEQINNGISYVENHTYSDKIITVIWEDERYTNMDSLKEDAEKKLELLSKPRRSFGCDVANLASVSDEYSILDYSLGDTITLAEKESGTREKQRIMKLVHYPDNPLKDTIDIENRPRMLGDREEKRIENLEGSNSIIRASLELLEDSVVSTVEKIENLRIEAENRLYQSQTQIPFDFNQGTGTIQLYREAYHPYYKVVSDTNIDLSAAFPQSQYAEDLTGEEVTISLDALVEVDRLVTMDGKSFEVPANRWTRIHVTKEFPENTTRNTRVRVPYSRQITRDKIIGNKLIDSLSADINTIYYRNLQVQKGDVPTNWTLTPEELEGQIDRYESEIKQLADEISLTVKKGDIISEINQTAEEVRILAEKIKFEGLVTANDNFKILEDGSIVTKNATIEGDIVSNNADIRGKVTAETGKVAGFNISGNNLVGNDVSLEPNKIKFGTSEIEGMGATALALKTAFLGVGNKGGTLGSGAVIQWNTNSDNSVLAESIGGSTKVFADEFVNTSDIRHKKLIQDIPLDLMEQIANIKPKMYEMKGKLRFGYIAQDVEREIFKYCLSKTNDLSLANEYSKKFAIYHKDESYLSLLYNEILVMKEMSMNNKIKEMEERIEKLEKNICNNTICNSSNNSLE